MRATVGGVLGFGRSKFPRGVASGTAALGLHVTLAWCLGWGLAGDGARVGEPRTAAALIWLDAEAPACDAADAAPAGPGASSEASGALPPPVRRAKATTRVRAARPAVALPADGGEAARPASADPDGSVDGVDGVASGSPAHGAGSGGAAPAGEGRGARPIAGRGAPAHLLGKSHPCADLFPYAARSDSGTVAVALDVATDGQPLEAHIVEELPLGQGFALAAHHCVRRLRFAPALDAEGHAVASRSVVRLRFARRTAAL